MKRSIAALLFCLSPTLHAQQSVPVIPFDSVPDPLKLPKDTYFGEMAGVAVNSRGHVFVLSFGHSVRVDKDDNIWAVDKGSDMVMKFNNWRVQKLLPH